LQSNRIQLLIDTFHLHLEEKLENAFKLLKKNISRVAHIHLADCNRRSPGSGHFDFKTFLGIFKNIGYDGFASIETIMKPSFEDVAKEASEYLRMII
jgi:sugar phosphate isomerase/epimerase